MIAIIGWNAPIRMIEERDNDEQTVCNIVFFPKSTNRSRTGKNV